MEAEESEEAARPWGEALEWLTRRGHSERRWLMGSGPGKGSPSSPGRWAPRAEHAGCWIQSRLGLARATQGPAGMSSGQWVSSSPRGRGGEGRTQLRVTNSKRSRLPPGDRTFWKACKSATDVTVLEVPYSSRAGRGEGTLGGLGSRAPTAPVMGFWICS